MHGIHRFVSVHIHSCVYGMCQKNVTPSREYGKPLLSCSLLHSVLFILYLWLLHHQTVFQRAFVCGAVSQIPAMAFLPSTSKLATFF